MHRWTTELDMKLIEYVGMNKTVDEIAQIMNRTKNAVYIRLLGLAIKDFSVGVPYEVIWSTYHISQRELSTAITKQQNKIKSHAKQLAKFGALETPSKSKMRDLIAAAFLSVAALSCTCC